MPPIWPGQTVAILASGPSMSAAVAQQLRGLTCIAINSTFRLAPWASVLYAADFGWWRHRDNADVAHFKGLRVSLRRPEVDPAPPPGVLCLENTGVVGFDRNPGHLRTGGNSGYQAIQLAAHAGAARVLLAGFDMHGGHWHPEHAEDLMQTTDMAFARWLERFPQLQRELQQAGGPEVINVTPGSKITCFPSMTIEEALATSAVSTA